MDRIPDTLRRERTLPGFSFDTESSKFVCAPPEAPSLTSALRCRKPGHLVPRRGLRHRLATTARHGRDWRRVLLVRACAVSHNAGADGMSMRRCVFGGQASCAAEPA